MCSVNFSSESCGGFRNQGGDEWSRVDLSGADSRWEKSGRLRKTEREGEDMCVNRNWSHKSKINISILSIVELLMLVFFQTGSKSTGRNINLICSEYTCSANTRQSVHCVYPLMSRSINSERCFVLQHQYFAIEIAHFHHFCLKKYFFV